MQMHWMRDWWRLSIDGLNHPECPGIGIWK